ncbi:MAG: Dyp-type peroxidase [Saprospiraceae bacterium]
MNAYKNPLLTEPAINIQEGHQQILTDLQANILRHHKRKYSRYLFLRFHEGAQIFVRKFMAKMGNGFVNNDVGIQLTSASQQFGKETLNSKSFTESNEIFGMYLTFQGYNFLELSNLAPADIAFQNASEKLTSATKGFHTGEPDNSFSNLHAMILVASNNRRDLDKCINALKSEMQISKNGEPLYISIIGNQSGESMFDRDNKTYSEHFGYVDGISQPRFFPSSNSQKSSVQLSSFSTLDTVLVRDLGGEDKFQSFGSFLVFLKLEQDVVAFEKLIKQIRGLNLKDKSGAPLVENDDDAKAIIMGRYPKGASILKKGRKDEYCFDNNYDYDELVSDGKEWKKDDQGIGCPFFSHARKANPRTVDSRYKNNNRITRRGVPYQDSENKKGLLFMSFQRNIQEQFEKLLTEMLHSSQLNGVHAGMDLLTGHHNNTRIINGNPNAVIKPTDPLITYRGGAYFFAPSLSFFKNITKFYPHIEEDINMAKSTLRFERKAVKIFDDFKNIQMKPIEFGDHRDEMIKSILEEANQNKAINEIATSKIGPVA